MLGEKMLATFKGNSKVLEMTHSDPSLTSIITRRTFLKTFMATAVGYYFFTLFPLTNEEKLLVVFPGIPGMAGIFLGI